jgi:hypothetical protein
MLSNSDTPNIAFAAKSSVTSKSAALIERRIWLPKVIYDGLPWFYLAAGVVAFLTTLYISAWFWILPHYFLFSAFCLHLSVLVFRRRLARKMRQDPSTTGN